MARQRAGPAGVRARHRLHEEQLHPAPALPSADEARRDDPAVVQDEQVAGSEEVGKVGEAEVAGVAAAARAGASRREASRGATGTCAMSSSGSSKSRSETSMTAIHSWYSKH